MTAERSVTARMGLDVADYRAGAASAIAANEQLAASAIATGEAVGAAATQIDVAAAREAAAAQKAAAAAASAAAREAAAYQARGQLITRAEREMGAAQAANAASTRAEAVTVLRAQREMETALAARAAAARAEGVTVIRAQREMEAAFARRAAAEEAASRRAVAAEEASAARIGKSLTATGRGFGILGLAAGAAAVISISKFADFDQEMSAVEAATHESAQAMGVLRDAAVDAGARTMFSATEAAAAEVNLAKAGIATADVVGGALSGSLNLAAAGGLAVADSAEFMATALTQFGLKGAEAGHVADVLAAGAGKAQGEVSDMAVALNYAGLPAHALGATLEETAGTIALFAKNGLIGEQAGTSLRGVLSSMTAPSKLASDTMAQYGITIFDTSGKFIGLAGVAQQLHKQLSGLTDQQRAAALGQMFGNQQLQAANILYQEGAAGVDEWTGKVNDAGYASQTAALMTDNLRGDVERFGGALDSAFIQTGSSANSALREITQTMTGLVDEFTGAPEWVQKTGLALLVVGAAVGVLGGGALILIPRLSALAVSLDALAAGGAAAAVGEEAAAVGATALAVSTSSAAAVIRGAVTLALGPWGIAIAAAFTIATVALGGWAHNMAEHKQDVDSFVGSLDDVTGALTDQSAKMISSALSTNEVSAAAKAMGVDIGAAARMAAEGGPAYDNLIRRLDDVAAAGTKSRVSMDGGAITMSDAATSATTLSKALEDQRSVVRDGLAEWQRQHAIQQALAPAIDAVTQSVGEQQDKIVTLSEATHDMTEGARSLAERMGYTTDEASALSQKIDDVKAAFDRLNGVNIDAIQAQIDYQGSLSETQSVIADTKEHFDDLGRIVTENGAAFDTTTEAGRRVEKQLLDQAKAAATSAKATFDQTGDLDTYNATLDESRLKLIADMKQAGLTEEAAKALADQVLATPQPPPIVFTDNSPESIKHSEAAEAAIRKVPTAWITHLTGDESDVYRAADAAQARINSLYGKTLVVYLQFKQEQSQYVGGSMGGGGQRVSDPGAGRSMAPPAGGRMAGLDSVPAGDGGSAGSWQPDRWDSLSRAFTGRDLDQRYGTERAAPLTRIASSSPPAAPTSPRTLVQIGRADRATIDVMMESLRERDLVHAAMETGEPRG